MTKPNWNRLAALEFAGRLLTGRSDIRAGEAQAHADWALQWLGGDAPNTERPPGRPWSPPPGGWIVPPNVPADAVPFVTGPPGTGKSYPGMGTVTGRVVPSEHVAAMRRAAESLAKARTTFVNHSSVEFAASSAAPEAPPRNVPTEGDGSMSVPVYRFFRECVDPDCKVVYYWREDTRNETNRWSIWTGPEPENGIPCWISRRDYDRGGQYAPPPTDQMTRLTTGDLEQLDIPIETRYDSEE